MRPASQSSTPPTRSHSPRAFTVFAAAFVAGAAAAVGVNSVLDVRLAQSKPRVESEPIFVALRSLPQGSPVTVWDVALRDWPRAMVPTSALRASDAFSGLVLKHPLREGQPLLSIQLVEAETRSSSPLSVTAVSSPAATVGRAPEADLWAPAEPTSPTPVTAKPVEERSEQVQAATQQPIPQPQPDTQATVVAPSSVSAPSAEPSAGEGPRPAAADATAIGDAIAATSAPAAPIEQINAAPAEMVDDMITDEILEAMAATTQPPATGTVTPPDEGVGPLAAGIATTPAADGTSLEDTPAATAASATPTPSPTLADPPLAPLTGETAVGESPTPASVMRRPTSDDDSAPAAVQPPPRVATRYLVVPESIALQADASFAAPSQPAHQPVPGPAAESVKPLPATGGAAGGVQPAGQPVHQRASQPRRGTSVAVPRPSQQPSATQTGGQQSRRGMFPNIAAGIESIESEMGRIRRDRAGQAEPAVPTRSRPQY